MSGKSAGGGADMPPASTGIASAIASSDVKQDARQNRVAEDAEPLTRLLELLAVG